MVSSRLIPLHEFQIEKNKTHSNETEVALIRILSLRLLYRLNTVFIVVLGVVDVRGHGMGFHLV